MRFDDISEGVAGPQKCWPGHRKIGTQPGTGKNAGKRVNKCKKIGEGLTDEINPADVGEYDREGEMAMGQLKTAEDAAAELRSILDADENLPEWVQSKITKAVDYLDTVRDYMKSKEQGVAEGSDSNVYFEVDSENAYNHILKKFGSVIEWDGDTMVAPRKYWGDIQELAYSAGGEATEVGDEQGVAEGEVTKTKTGLVHRSTDKYGGAKDDEFDREFGKYAKDLTHLNMYKTGKLDKAMGVKHDHGNKKSTNEANYYNPLDQERREQDAMDYSKKAFKRAEHQAEWEREQEVARQRQQADRGPWYLRIDGKVYRQKGQPKAFDWKKGANNYALKMIENRPELQGKIMLTKSDQDQ